MDENIAEDDDHAIDYNRQFSNSTPFPPRCENEVDGILALSKCFKERYEDCPLFFEGSLQNACKEAFSSIPIQERRPVLVYIHNDESELRKKFCKDTFCSEKIINYLLENYIVWPWDITFQWNKNKLIKYWEETFSTEFWDEFLIGEWPLMIGIMRRFEFKTDAFITAKYQFKSLLKTDDLVGKQKPAMCEIALSELSHFKKLCDENEQDLSFDFCGTTGLCWDIILEIAQYLSLNDTISVFSTNILPLFNDGSKFQLSNPNIPFIKMILSRSDPTKIVSLKLDGDRIWSEKELTLLSSFKKVISMTLLNLTYDKNICQYGQYFPELTCLSLCYDNEINLSAFSSIFNQLWEKIRRFEIRCAGTLCTHYDYDMSQLVKLYKFNFSVKYFLFDIGQFPWASMNACYDNDPSCCLKSITSVIKKMFNIQYLHFIINTYDIEIFLNINPWGNLVNDCFRLKNIKIQTSESIVQSEELKRKVCNIQTALHAVRQTIKFQICTL
ncbi:unnamed protein product [Rotaria socialis]|uniref:UAS domain-containing protein n=2 Tax=Rotaria socialis TaxID=392032 RepID=A0A818D672_9BILA|nr:unnamed protein product [Rotaria socialis]CAF3442317.1 unnamed protein product [Rotaria socialis]CAF4339892.1 unnamed protein product [Rotaria socialis]